MSTAVCQKWVNWVNKGDNNRTHNSCSEHVSHCSKTATFFAKSTTIEINVSV